MKRELFAVAVAAGVVLGAVADEVVRWYDEAQRLSWGYTVTNGEATISTPGFWDSNARDYCKGDIVVPARIGPDGPDGSVTYPVRDMKPGLFSNCKNVTSVKLPDGIRRIAPNAFYFDSGSTITNVTVGAGCLDIGENAFCRCENLTSVNVPNTVTNIAKDAFTMCYALKSVDIPGSVKTIGDRAFAACYALEAATFGYGIETIEADAFMGCGMLAAADLPASVTFIGDRAFSGCNALGECSLCEGLKSIGNYAFSSCGSLTNVTIPASVERVGANVFDRCPDSLFDTDTVEGVKLLSGWAVAADNPSGDIDLSGVNGVADGVFKWQRMVTSVTLPAGQKTIGDSLFNQCTSLKTVGLPSALKSIGDYAFQDCAAIERVVVPLGVTNIGHYAFTGCGKLEHVELPESLVQMGEGVFSYCSVLAEVDVPGSLRRIPMGTFEWCTGLTNVTVNPGTEVIGNAAFYHCTALPSFEIPDWVTVVEEIAFGSCTFVDTNTIADVEMVDGWIVDANTENLTDVTVPGDVRGIANNAFDNCRKLTNAVLEAGVAKIPDYAFNCATTLADVSIPDSVEEIGAFAFCDCDSLVEAWVPSNVVFMGEKVFASCDALEAVYLPVSLLGQVNESNLIDGSFNATVRYYNPDGSLLPPPVPGPNPDVETRTVTFNANGGEFDDEGDSTREVEKGTAVGTLPVPTREGYAFAGWWTAKTKGTKISASTKVTKNVTYYARWTVRKYKVSAAVNLKAGGTVSGTGSKAYKSKVVLKATPKKGYVFVRWENQNDLETPWPSVAKYRQPSVSFTMGAANVSVKAVFAKTSADKAPVVSLLSSDIWYVEDEPEREVEVYADSLSYPKVTLSGAPAGIGLVAVPGTDGQYVLKVTDLSKMKPGVYTAKVTAKNRAGKSAAKSMKIVAPNSTAAIDAGLIAGLETSTLSPYIPEGGMKTKWTLEDIGVEVFATNGWKLVSVTGLPTGLSWNGTAIVGAASKAGIYTVTFKMQRKAKIGKTTKTYTSVATATFKVDALLPAELAGVYNGFANTSIAASEEEEGVDGDAEVTTVYSPLVDSWASSAKITVTAAGKITANIGGVTLSGNGFDGVSNGVYSVSLKKTQKITKGALKGKSKVWELHLDIAPEAPWDSAQLVGEYHSYTTGLSSMTAPAFISAQRNAFGTNGSDDAKAVAAAVAKFGTKGVVKFTPKAVKGEDWQYGLALGGKALAATAKANGAVTLAGTIAKTAVSGSAVLEVSAAETVELEPDEQSGAGGMSIMCSDECEEHTFVTRRTATARFFTSKFVVAIVYTLEDGAVVSASGRVWKK